VNYDDDNWNALTNQLYNDCNVIHVLNRAQMIDDAFNLALANRLDYTFVLGLTKYLKKEHDVVPWYSAKNGFAYLLQRMRRCPDGYKYFKVSYLEQNIVLIKISILKAHNDYNYVRNVFLSDLC